MDTLEGKDDLHTAIIAVSIVEAHLQKLLISRLKKSDKEFINRLFENRGPLGDFNSKILVAEAFGLLTGPLANELHILRSIRNTFAHAKMPLSFELEPIKSEVRKISLIAAMKRPNVPEPLGEWIEKMPPQRAFLLAVRIILILIDEIARKKSSADKVLMRVLKVK